MSIVEGFAGLRIKDDKLSFSPSTPQKWDFYEFTIQFRGVKLEIRIDDSIIEINNTSDKMLDVSINGKLHSIISASSTSIGLSKKEVVSWFFIKGYL